MGEPANETVYHVTIHAKSGEYIPQGRTELIVIPDDEKVTWLVILHCTDDEALRLAGLYHEEEFTLLATTEGGKEISGQAYMAQLNPDGYVEFEGIGSLEGWT